MKKILNTILAFVFAFCLISSDSVSFAEEITENTVTAENAESGTEASALLVAAVAAASAAALLSAVAVILLLLAKKSFGERRYQDEADNEIPSDLSDDLNENIEKNVNLLKNYIDSRFEALENEISKLRADIDSLRTAADKIVRESKKSDLPKNREVSKPNERRPRTPKGIFTEYLNKRDVLPKGFVKKNLYLDEGNVRLSNSEAEGTACYICRRKQQEGEVDEKAYIFPTKEFAVERGDARYTFYDAIYDFEEGTGKIEVIQPCEAIVGINGRYEILQRGMIDLP